MESAKLDWQVGAKYQV